MRKSCCRLLRKAIRVTDLNAAWGTSGSRFFTILFLVLLSPALTAICLTAAEHAWDIESQTILRVFERQDLDGNDGLLLPVYEYLTVDYGRPLSDGLSFHVRGWGRHDLSGNDFYDKTGDGDFLYGYLGYQFSRGGPAVNLGRQTILTGITAEAIDGLCLQTPFSRWLTITAYGGSAAGDDGSQAGGKQRIFGGRLALNPARRISLGISYHLTRDSNLDSKTMGIDLSATLLADMIISGYSSLNTDSGSWAEHAYELAIPLGAFQVAGMYQKIEFQDMFDEQTRTSGPFRFLGRTDETLTATGGDLSWLSGSMEMGLQVKNYAYDRRSESNLYAAGFLDWAFSRHSQIILEYGRMDGDNPENRFNLARCGIKTSSVPFLSSKDILSADLMYVGYLEPIYNQKQSYSAVFSYSRRLFKDMAAMVISCDYGRDPYFDQDVEATLMIIYDGGAGSMGIRP